MARTLNLGILAHVDAGKTSLTERLLLAAGVIDELGSVDDGSTRTDSLALERRRGITIKSAVVSFAIGDVTVNLIDTPGHPDFIAEVELVLGVLDGAVLVVSAVEGVQAQTRVLMRALQRLGLPTLIFVNKIDRSGADVDRVVGEIREKLSADVVAVDFARGQGTRAAAGLPRPVIGEYADQLLDLLARHDDEVLAAYVRDEAALSPDQLSRELAKQARAGRVHPVICGSAMTGAGLDALMTGLTQFLPTRAGDGDGPAAGVVFKVERGPGGEKIAYVRMFAGTLRTRDRVGGERVTAVSVFTGGGVDRRAEVRAGEIGLLWGLASVRIGAEIGDHPAGRDHHFSPPTLETFVRPADPRDRGRLHAALAQLAEQDPLINLRSAAELSLSLYGEVQKEVIEATLAEEYGITVSFTETTTLHIERLTGRGASFEIINKGGNPFLATVGLRVEPAPPGSGVDIGLEVELGSMPYAFFTAVEETVRQALRQGLHGWDIPDCRVLVTHSGYWPRQSHAHGTFDKSMSSTAGDFRLLTPLVLLDAVGRAGTEVHEPMHRFRLETPGAVLSAVLPVLNRLRGVPGGVTAQGSSYVVVGDLPASQVHALTQALPGLTGGEGVLESEFSHYSPVAGAPPDRERTDHNPLDRKEYLLHVVRRV